MHLFHERPIRYQFILENTDIFSIEKMCRSVIVSKNAYYHWLKAKDSIVVETTRIYLKKRMKAIFEASREIDGSHRIQKKLDREGLTYCSSYIGLLMK
jgi:hypothetical protein